MTPTPTTIVEVMKPQPDGVLHGQPGKRKKIKGYSGLTTSEWSPIQPDHQPGDIIERDEKRREVVRVWPTQVKSVAGLLGFRHMVELEGANKDDWVWVYEVKGVGDE